MKPMADPREHPLANYPRPPPRGEDLPYSDGEPMESQNHVDQMLLLIHSLRNNWRHPDGFYAGGNMFVYFSETQARNNDFRGPDVFVVVGRPAGPPRRSWVVWEEDGRLPDVVVELLSPSTERVDRGEKMRLYRDVWRLPRYYLFDPFTLVLEGYALEAGAYRRIEPDADGCLECAPLGLRLGLRDTAFGAEPRAMLRWIDADGRPLPTGEERAEAEARRADAEAERADALARRVAELEAKAKG